MADLLRALMLLLLVGLPARAQEVVDVDVELLLLADATSSIDDIEYRMQRQGYASAMVDPQVLRAIENGGERGRIAVSYVEWAGRRTQNVVVDWMLVEGEASAQEFAARLLAAPRRTRGTNAIGAALMRGLEMLAANDFAGARRVLDLSGDSSWNPRPPSLAEARDAAIAADVAINGLAILCYDCSGRQGSGDLEADFVDRLIAGPGAFVITADARQSFAQAVRRKLILEIADSTSR